LTGGVQEWQACGMSFKIPHEKHINESPFGRTPRTS
jgi:hypothetical protein